MAQKYTTRCNIPDAEGHPCGQEIVITPGLDVPEIGAVPAPKTKVFVQAIVSHMMKKHPPLAALAMNSMEQFLAYFTIGFTQSQDPGVLTFMALFAEHLAKLSTIPVTDQMIVELVTRMGLAMEDPQRQKIIEAMGYVRDFQLRRVTQSMMTSA
jgi:hypothetical protein